ncbi:MAG: hypothetical protein ACKOE7_00100, partial [Actinomycetota bacterium]
MRSSRSGGCTGGANGDEPPTQSDDEWYPDRQCETSRQHLTHRLRPDSAGGAVHPFGKIVENVVVVAET